MKKTHALPLVAAALLAAGCAIGPDAKRPDMAMPEAWREATPSGEAVANLPWWEVFQDADLSTLVREALANNRNLGLATARIEEARALTVAARAGLLPAFGAQGAVDDGHAELNRGSSNAVIGTMSWELDVWGKLRRANEAARDDLLTATWNRDAVVLTLVADVAAAWVQLRALDEQLDIARRTLETRRRSLELVTSRFRGGVTAEIDVFQVTGLETDAAARVAALERAGVQTENALGVLVGRMPGPVARPHSPVLLSRDYAVPAGIPAAVLDRRPDLQAAESSLAAATARVGVAIGDRLPAFALTAAGGTISTDAENLFTGGTWNVALNMTAPVFEFGRRKALQEAAEARMEQARFAYEQTVLQSIREVNDALVAMRTWKDEQAARQRGVEAARNAVRLSTARYDGGVTSYLEVLDSERTRFASELALVDAATGRTLSLIALYKALGGGWQPQPSAAPQSPAVSQSGGGAAS